MQTDLPMAARGGLDEILDLVIALPGAIFFRGIADLTDKVRKQSCVLLSPEQNAVGRLTIASGAASFLVVLLDRLRKGQVNHGADRGLVDPQPEGNGADEDAYFVRSPFFLVAATLLGFHLPVIRNGRYALVG